MKGGTILVKISILKDEGLNLRRSTPVQNFIEYSPGILRNDST